MIINFNLVKIQTTGLQFFCQHRRLCKVLLSKKTQTNAIIRTPFQFIEKYHYPTYENNLFDGFFIGFINFYPCFL
jgi:hypothetical protein